MKGKQWLTIVAVVSALGMWMTNALADDVTKGSRQAEKGQIDKSRMGDRGEPGKNMGGQHTPPGEGEQTGRPGTSFGAPATLPPADEAPQYEGADKQQKGGKKAPTEGGPR